MLNKDITKSEFKNTIPLSLFSDKKDEKSGDVVTLRRVFSTTL
jgi:hypothetical protein